MAKQNADDDSTRADVPGPAAGATPGTVRGAGALAALEGLIGVIIAIVLVIQGHDKSAYGTAAWFVILAGAVLAAGIGLLRGRRWGRAIVVIAQILLLPAAWYMLSSHRLELAIPVGLAALATLGLIFAPASVRWMAAAYDVTD
ncbi:putative membrane protein [Nocardia nova SH22a]|uniref:Putative membrane protein n=1 Tax=Nocardia nova SH22a TaxID=1415166 RepID=W5TAL8_9NOCA|nr:hypothetical protein [Nocardia nova]AHH16199.1 putative membrane protein [Nocardia nova SH22a]